MVREHRHKKLTVDLTGLPEPVVSHILQLVQEARDHQGRTGPSSATFVSRADTRPEVLAQGLVGMATMGTGRPLPLDWSRDDVYDDHD